MAGIEKYIPAMFILGIYRGNTPPKVLYPPPQKKVSKLCKTIPFRLLVTCLLYRCSSEWKITSLYYISLLSANACSGTCNDSSHRHYTVIQRPSASKTVHWTVKIASKMHQKSLFGDQKSKKNSGEGTLGLPKPSHSPKLAVSRINAAFPLISSCCRCTTEMCMDAQNERVTEPRYPGQRLHAEPAHCADPGDHRVHVSSPVWHRKHDYPRGWCRITRIRLGRWFLSELIFFW